MDKYTLSDRGEPVPEPDIEKWAAWFECSGASRIVSKDKVGKSEVSTVFLGFDHNWRGGPPVLWETMVFGGVMNGEQARCAGGREQAEAMHAEMLARVRAIGK